MILSLPDKSMRCKMRWMNFIKMYLVIFNTTTMPPM